MHSSVIRYVTEVVRACDLEGKRVLEIGSMDVNGSVRPIFKTDDYLGTDMQPGPGVDKVINAHALVLGIKGMEESFDVIVCCEMLEHDDQPWLTLSNAYECAKDGGFLILTARGFDERGCWPLHGYPDDHWRYSQGAIRRLLEYTGWQPRENWRDPEGPGVLALAQR